METLNCGHTPTAIPGCTGTGYGVTPDGYTLCYQCGYEDTLAAMRWETTLFAYQASNGMVTDWPGHHLGKITAQRVVTGGVASRLKVEMIDLHGQRWHGTGPTDSGTYLRLRKAKG